jgi:CDP-diglyceride synthetase
MMMVSKLLDVFMSIMILFVFMSMGSGWVWLGMVIALLLLLESHRMHRKPKETPEREYHSWANTKCPVCKNIYNKNAKECPRC